MTINTKKTGTKYTFTDSHTHIELHPRMHTAIHICACMRHISPAAMPDSNMVGNISMATAGRRGADLCGMISRERVLFDFWFKQFSFNSFNTFYSTVRISASFMPVMAKLQHCLNCKAAKPTQSEFVFARSSHCFVFINLGLLIKDNVPINPV